jgi:hypothetical protein
MNRVKNLWTTLDQTSQQQNMQTTTRELFAIRAIPPFSNSLLP